MRGAIVSGFPAVGKTTAAALCADVTDLDSSGFKWSEPGVVNPSWPANYMARVLGESMGGRTVVVSSHSEVRAALVEAGLQFVLAYPHPLLRDEYRRRMLVRGSPVELVEKVMELWTPGLTDCAEQRGCVQVVMRSMEFLVDLMPPRCVAAAHGRRCALPRDHSGDGHEAADGYRWEA